MKLHFLTLMLIGPVLAANATELPFYIGTYTSAGKSEGIYRAVLDSETGKLGLVTLAAVAHNPNFLAFSPNGKFLYSAIEDSAGAVAAFAVEGDGKLRLLNEKKSGGSSACHVAVDAKGRTVFAADYGGGSISAMQTNEDGSLRERTAFIRFAGSGPDAGRQQKPHAHSVYLDPGNRFLYVCDLGTDNVWIFKFDSDKGTLTPADPASGKVPPGAGPRHLAFSQNGKFAYVLNEMGMSVTTFACDPDTGSLHELKTVSTLPEGVGKTGCSAAEIFSHPTGKWLYASNRGQDSITAYNLASDIPRWIGNTPAQVKTPRSFAIDPTGRWLVAAGQTDHRLTSFKIDQVTGKLTATGETASCAAPVCVLFSPR